MVSRLQGTRFSRPAADLAPDEQAARVAAAADGSRALVTWVRVDPPAYIGGTRASQLSHRLPAYSLRPARSRCRRASSRTGRAAAERTGAPAAAANGPWTVAWQSRTPAGTSFVVRVASGDP